LSGNVIVLVFHRGIFPDVLSLILLDRIKKRPFFHVRWKSGFFFGRIGRQKKGG
jgi:hypothetical protein